MRYLLDTDVVSQLIKANGNTSVLRWLELQREGDLYLSVISILEIRVGIEKLPVGKRRAALEHWLNLEISVRFAGRILPVDERIADESGRILGLNHRKGNHPSPTDALIAATAKVHGFQMATLNRSHFEPLNVQLVQF